jgi:hypothetical protein
MKAMDANGEPPPWLQDAETWRMEHELIAKVMGAVNPSRAVSIQDLVAIGRGCLSRFGRDRTDTELYNLLVQQCTEELKRRDPIAWLAQYSLLSDEVAFYASVTKYRWAHFGFPTLRIDDPKWCADRMLTRFTEPPENFALPWPTFMILVPRETVRMTTSGEFGGKWLHNIMVHQNPDGNLFISASDSEVTIQRQCPLSEIASDAIASTEEDSDIGIKLDNNDHRLLALCGSLVMSLCLELDNSGHEQLRASGGRERRRRANLGIDEFVLGSPVSCDMRAALGDFVSTGESRAIPKEAHPCGYVPTRHWTYPREGPLSGTAGSRTMSEPEPVDLDELEKRIRESVVVGLVSRAASDTMRLTEVMRALSELRAAQQTIAEQCATLEKYEAASQAENGCHISWVATAQEQRATIDTIRHLVRSEADDRDLARWLRTKLEAALKGPHD